MSFFRGRGDGGWAEGGAGAGKLRLPEPSHLSIFFMAARPLMASACARRRSAYCAVKPPSIEMFAPVTGAAASEHR